MLRNGSAAAANGTGASFHIHPGIVLEGMAVAFSIPGLSNGIVCFPTVRVHGNRKLRFFSQLLDEAFKVFGFRAVDTYSPEMGSPFTERFGAVPNQVALVDMKPILTGETNPIISANPFCNPGFNLCFRKGRLSLERRTSAPACQSSSARLS